MVHPHKPGAPLPFDVVHKPDVVVLEAGSFDKADGIRVVLTGNNLMFLAAFDETHITLGIDIHDLLEAVQTHTRGNES